MCTYFFELWSIALYISVSWDSLKVPVIMMFFYAMCAASCMLLVYSTYIATMNINFSRGYVAMEIELNMVH